MMVFLIVLTVFALAMLAMAMGLVFGKRCLRGSCGGLAGLNDESGRQLCEACRNPPESCSGHDDPRRGIT